MGFVRLVIHKASRPLANAACLVSGWNPHLTARRVTRPARLSSHTKRVRYGVGIPVCLAKTKGLVNIRHTIDNNDKKSRASKNGKKYGLINKQGKFIIPPESDRQIYLIGTPTG
jgi:hypothetical protein